MNNSKIAIDEISISLDTPVDNTELLREKESELVRIIEALDRIKDSEEWSSLQTLIFAKVAENLERRLKNESEKLELHGPTINQLQGQLLWARKFADLSKLAESYRVDLSNIRKTLTQPTGR